MGYGSGWRREGVAYLLTLTCIAGQSVKRRDTIATNGRDPKRTARVYITFPVTDIGAKARLVTHS